MKVEKMKWITREIVRANPHKAFLFGDNVERVGMGGQAKEMRGEPNAIGIVTKWAPSNDESAFFSDTHFVENCERISNDIRRLYVARSRWETRFDTIVIPSDGIGTGLAELDKRAPETFAYLEKRLAELESK